MVYIIYCTLVVTCFLSSSPLEYTITLSRKGSGSLGFSIVGGVNSRHGNSPIYIKGIASKSIADIDGRLKVSVIQLLIT